MAGEKRINKQTNDFFMNKNEKKKNDSMISANVNGIEIAHYPLQASAYFFLSLLFNSKSMFIIVFQFYLFYNLLVDHEE